MAEDLPIKTIIELVFFALFVLLAIYIVITFYGALFPEDTLLEDLKQRVEFTVCGAYSTYDERSCPSDKPMRNLFVAEADIHDRLFFFSKPNERITTDEFFIFDNEAVFGIPTGLNIFPETTAQYFDSPCNGACVCQVNIGDDETIMRNQCIDLDVGDKEIQFVRYPDDSVYTSTKKFLTSFFTDTEDDKSQVNRKPETGTPYIAPIPASWWSSIPGSPSELDLNYFLLHIEYIPATQNEIASLLVTPYDPELYAEPKKT
jgi:hypothetical protein